MARYVRTIDLLQDIEPEERLSWLAVLRSTWLPVEPKWIDKDGLYQGTYPTYEFEEIQDSERWEERHELDMAQVEEDAETLRRRHGDATREQDETGSEGEGSG